MASITEVNGVKTLQVVRPDGARKSINLGRVDEATATTSAKMLQAIVDADRNQQPADVRSMKWLASLSDKIHARVARAGLTTPRALSATPARVEGLDSTITAYIERRTDIEPSTIADFEKTQKNLVEFFGENMPLANITPARADDFKRWLLAKYSRATTCQRIKRTKTILRDAVRRGLLTVMPFADVTAGSDSNSENDAFIERATIEKVIAATPDVSWKLIIALSRYGGLRIPSELERLRWRDVLWSERRIMIYAKKTKKIEGKAVRVLPLFDELELLLRQAFDEAPDGAEFVIPDRLRLHSNLGSPFQDLITRAAVTPWPRQFHNLRASRQTELLDLVPLKTVCNWLGNDERTAMKHYMRTTKDHFDRVLSPRPDAPAKTSADFSAAMGGKALQGFATSIVGSRGKAKQGSDLHSSAVACNVLQDFPKTFNGPRGTRRIACCPTGNLKSPVRAHQNAHQHATRTSPPCSPLGRRCLMPFVSAS